MNVAVSIAKEKDAEIFVTHVVSLPPQTPLNVGKQFIEERKELLEKADGIGESNNIPVSFTLRISHKVYQGILDSVLVNRGNLLILGSGKTQPRRRIMGNVLDPLLQEVPCDIGILKVQDQAKVKNILVPTAGGPNARLALELGGAIVNQTEGRLTMLHVIRDESEREKAIRRIKETKKDLKHGGRGIEEKVVLGEDVTESILHESVGYDLIIMGASKLGLWRRVRFGTVPEKLMRLSQTQVLFIRKYEGKILSWIRRFIAG